MLNDRKAFDRRELADEIVYNLAMPEPILYEFDRNLSDEQMTPEEREYRDEWLKRRFEWFAQTSPIVIGDLLWLQQHRPVSNIFQWRFEEVYNWPYEDLGWRLAIGGLLKDWIAYSPVDTAVEFVKYIDDPQYRLAILKALPDPTPCEFLPLLVGQVAKAQELTDDEVSWLAIGIFQIISMEADILLKELDRQARGRSADVDRELASALKHREFIHSEL